MNKSFVLSIVVLVGILFSDQSFALAPNTNPILGKWRGTFIGFNNTEIPFIFEIKFSNKQTSLYFINGTETYYGGKLAYKGDSILVALDQFDKEFAFSLNKNAQLVGYWRKQNGAGDSFAILASKENNTRFRSSGLPPFKNVSGKYDVVFSNDSGKQTKAVGLFEQTDEKISLTFLRASGDSRFSEGILNGNQFNSSLFIGYSPLLFKGIVNVDGSILGEQIGLKSTLKFVAIKNAQAKLQPSNNEVSLTKNNQPFNFSFRNMQGKMVSLNDIRYKNKPVIVTIGGTWCPNCADEAMFLANWYKKNHQRGIEIITIQFEIINDFTYAQKQMKRFQQRFLIPYEQVFGGLASNEKVMESLPSLTEFKAFPTTLFINKKQQLVKIHSGFAGPATGKFYTNLIKEFNDTVNSLLQ